VGRDGGDIGSDLVHKGTDLFLQMGLDWANQLDPPGEFSLLAQAQ
jgi:hypothetical protein